MLIPLFFLQNLGVNAGSICVSHYRKHLFVTISEQISKPDSSNTQFMNGMLY